MEGPPKKSKVALQVGSNEGMKPNRPSGAFDSQTSRLKLRKSSYGFTGVASVKPIERTSIIGIEFRRPLPTYLPTYQLDPRISFHVPSVEKATAAVLDEMFTDHKYNVQESPALAVKVAGDLMRRCKVMGFDRYRIIVVVTLAQKRSQSYNNAVSFLWDHERDNYVNQQRETTSAFIQVTVFGVYLD